MSELTDAHRQYWNKRGVTDDILDTLGIEYTEKGDWKWFCIPIMDFSGKVRYWKLRKAPGGAEKQPRFMYNPKGSKATLWPWPYLHRGIDKIYLCEGESDVMALLSKGIEAITSTSGVKTFESKWLPFFPENIKVVCCFDRDEAGDAGREKVEEVMKERPDITLTHLRIPDDCPGKDMTDYLLWKK